jgi:hypothetical protein
MRWGIVLCASLVAIALTLPTSCGGRTDPCEQRGICPKDVAPTPSHVAICEQEIQDPLCGAKYRALLQCVASSEQCSADGTENVQASSAAGIADCAGHTLQQAWLACERAEIGDAGSAGD